MPKEILCAFGIDVDAVAGRDQFDWVHREMDYAARYPREGSSR